MSNPYLFIEYVTLWRVLFFLIYEPILTLIFKLV